MKKDKAVEKIDSCIFKYKLRKLINGGVTMNETKVDYINGKLFPMILKFSIPAAVSLLLTAVYNIGHRMSDGNFNGTSALAGLTVCFAFFSMMCCHIKRYDVCNYARKRYQSRHPADHRE